MLLKCKRHYFANAVGVLVYRRMFEQDSLIGASLVYLVSYSINLFQYSAQIV